MRTSKHDEVTRFRVFAKPAHYTRTRTESQIITTIQAKGYSVKKNDKQDFYEVFSGKELLKTVSTLEELDKYERTLEPCRRIETMGTGS